MNRNVTGHNIDLHFNEFNLNSIIDKLFKMAEEKADLRANAELTQQDREWIRNEFNDSERVLVNLSEHIRSVLSDERKELRNYGDTYDRSTLQIMKEEIQAAMNAMETADSYQFELENPSMTSRFWPPSKNARIQKLDQLKREARIAELKLENAQQLSTSRLHNQLEKQ